MGERRSCVCKRWREKWLVTSGRLEANPTGEAMEQATPRRMNASGGIERRWIPVEGCLDRKPLRVVREQQP